MSSSPALAAAIDGDPTAPALPAPVPASAARAALDLQRSLAWRLLVFALIVALAMLAIHAWQLRREALSETPSTAAIVQQLLNQDQLRHAHDFNREVIEVDLGVLAPLARRLAFCVEVDDLWSRRIAHACLAPGVPGSAADILGAVVDQAARRVDTTRLMLLRAPGIAVGEIRVRPYWAMEAARWLAAASAIAAAWLALGFLAAALLRPVRRALRPVDQILTAIGRLAAGDTQSRLPALELREFRQIAGEFNSLARQLGATRAAERRLAMRLLDVREDERRFLARELHDDMGQHLTFLRAELAFLQRALPEAPPVVAPAFANMAETLARMHEGIQRIVHRLRPARLDEFGLLACLEQLVADAGRLIGTSGGSASLRVEGPLAALPAALEIHLYRIAQEGLTNALRHAAASQIELVLLAGPQAVSLTVSDNGCGATDPARNSEGHGRLGIRERVSALGGSVEWRSAVDGGTRLTVSIPLPGAPDREA